MATRFYLPASGTAPLGSLAVDSQWELSDSLDRRPCDVVKSNTSLTQKSATWSSITTQQWVWVQFQSKRLAAGYSWTTSDTVSMVIKCAEAVAQVDSHLCYVIRVVSGDGSTIRGTIGSYLTTSSEYPTSLATIATRIHSARTDGASNFSSQAGDRIIIEIGHHGVSPALNVAYHNYGDPSATSDYALTAGLTTDLCPWVELSRNVSFDVTTSKSVYIKGATTATPTVAHAYVEGGNPSYPASSSKSAYIKGYVFEITNKSAYLKGSSLITTSVSAYLPAGSVVTTNKAAYVKGYLFERVSTPAYLIGSISVASSIHGYLPAGSVISTSKTGYLKGCLSSSDSKPAYIEGFSTGGEESSNISALVIGLDNGLIPNWDEGSEGMWKNELDSETELYQSIDEYPLHNDNDFIYNINPVSGDYYECGLSNPAGTPGSGDVIIFWRGRDKTGLGHMQATVQLRQGNSTVIASAQQTLTTVQTIYHFTLTPAERTNITDWTDLRVRIIITEI